MLFESADRKMEPYQVFLRENRGHFSARVNRYDFVASTEASNSLIAGKKGRGRAKLLALLPRGDDGAGRRALF